MYHALLTNRYLTTRVIPLIAVAAVALCTALVITVVSVMSGFVDMVRNAGKTLMGDVIISYPIRGLPHYQELIEEINALPESLVATPVIDSWGLLRMPYDETEVVQVWGIEPETFGQITAYFDSIYWQTSTDEEWMAALKNVTREMWEWEGGNGERFFSPEQIANAESMTSNTMLKTLLALASTANKQKILDLRNSEMREQLPELLGPDSWYDLWLRDPMLLDNLDPVVEAAKSLKQDDGDAIVVGLHISQANRRRKDGTIQILGQGRWWLPHHKVTLTMLPVSDGGQVSDPQSYIFPVVNEIKFGVFAIDDKRVFVPLVRAQKMLSMDEATIYSDEFDPETGEMKILSKSPPRATLVLVGAAEGVSPAELKAKVELVYENLRLKHIQENVSPGLPDRAFGVSIKTWEEQNAQIIGPVEKERNLMSILFSIIYFVCGGLVLVIFWSIVHEKTKDIGILRSIGASRFGILWIFVRYGFVVGVIGSVVGLGLAYLVVTNINHIHDALGDPFPIWMWSSIFLLAAICIGVTVKLLTRDALLPVVVMVLISILLMCVGVAMAAHKGFLVWDPEVYYFTEIPNTLDMGSALFTLAGAIIFSVVGALIPAARAGDIDPVAALRYE